MLQDFKDFINKGNVIDLAVAVVLGAAFAPVVGTIVDRVLMPIIGLIVGSPNFDTIGTFACEKAGDPTSGILLDNGDVCSGSAGAVITVIVNFVLIAAAVFGVVKAYNSMRKTEEAAPEVPAGPTAEELLAEIRDELKAARS